MKRKIEHARDTILRGVGTDEAWIEEPGPNGRVITWRKPLSLIEINQMAPTPEVRSRPGRP